MSDWSPSSYARPTEWLLRVSESQPPYAVVRRMLLGDPNRPDEWFRVVTYAPTSEGRELIGWVRTLDDACLLGWDYKVAFESWRHDLAARRVEAKDMVQPPAGELVKFWREHRNASNSVSL